MPFRVNFAPTALALVTLAYWRMTQENGGGGLISAWALHGLGKDFTRTFPAYSITVLQIAAK